MRPQPKIRTEISKIVVANFVGGIFILRPPKPKKYYTSAVATLATQVAPVLTAVFEMPRCAIHCYCPTMATLLYTYFG